MQGCGLVTRHCLLLSHAVAIPSHPHKPPRVCTYLGRQSVEVAEQEWQPDCIETQEFQLLNNGCKVTSLPGVLLLSLSIQAIHHGLAIVEAKPAQGFAPHTAMSCTCTSEYLLLLLLLFVVLVLFLVLLLPNIPSQRDATLLLCPHSTA